jgi:4-amino-4-deoxychorismate lyase
MVKFFTQNYSYDYPFPTVTLAYFLRYPNPFSTHVLSTDVIERSFDPATQRLHTTRLHLKRSKAPGAVLKLIPRSLVGASATGDSQTYILERSTVDVKEGWMRTESRNLEWTGVLSVVERQMYRAASAEATPSPESTAPTLRSPLDALAFGQDEHTDVTTTVTLYSRLGQRFKRARQADAEGEEKVGFFRSWSQASLQRSIEAIGLRRTSKSQPNATEGMKVVLERLRKHGIVGVLEGMRKDREQAMGIHNK